jgi:hypothetical protein
MSDPSAGISMPFANVLRGRIAERIFVSLLERGGYRVTRLGIEELFDEVKYLPLKQYLDLGLPKALRSLPDLLVADPAVSWAALLEIKFRRRFDRTVAGELHSTLVEQRRSWPESHAIIMIGQPFVEGGRFHQDYIRVVPAGQLDRLLFQPVVPAGTEERQIMSRVWDQLPMITSLFRTWKFDQSNPHNVKRGHDFWAGADYVTAAIRELTKI